MRCFFLVFMILFVGSTGKVSAQDHYPDYMKMALKAFQSQKYDLAIGYYESALDDQPNDSLAYQGIGTCYYMKGKKKDALKAYEKALKLNPGNVRLASFVEAFRRQLAAATSP